MSPSDLLPTGDIAATPWPFNPAWFLLLAMIVPVGVWFACACRRVLNEDPHRLRRSGLRELRRLLKSIRSTPQSTHLQCWLRAAAKTWDVRVSAPTSKDISHASHALTGDAALTSQWHDLCCATERGLFAADATPPQDWLERASTAAAELRIPPRERWFPHRLVHWLPSLAVIMLTAATALTAHAEGALQALRTHWTDWAAHHNVAVARMQAEDWNAAAAHAAIAFIQHPATVNRESLRLALEQTGAADSHLRPLLFGLWYQRIPAWLSAASWQKLTLAASVLLAAALTGFVLHLYRPDPRLRWASQGGLAISAAVLTLSIFAWTRYGPLNQPSAAILLRGVNLSPTPTDLVPEEETSPIAAGTVVLTQRTFLGWQQISTGNSVSGWIRRNAVLPFYARPTDN